MSESNFTGVVEALLKGMDSVLSAKTVVGEAKKYGETIILPLVDVSFGVGAGSAMKDKRSGASGGMGGKMTPSAVLVIKNGQTKLVNIRNQDTVTKILDMIPDLVDRFTTPKEAMVKDEDAVETVFPEEENKSK